MKALTRLLMSTATDERVELDIDLDKAIPCQHDGGCTEPATWTLRLHACGHPVLLCQPHHDYIGTPGHPWAHVDHTSCRTRSFDWTWRAL